MKKYFIIISLIFFIVNIFPSSVLANESSTLKVYNWGEYISNGDYDTLNVIKEFEKQNPNVKVEYTTYASNEEMYAKISSGSANYDILVPSDYMVGKLISENLLAKINFNNIPNFSDIDSQFKNLEYDPTNEYSVPYTWGTVGIIYNKNKVLKPVNSWDILWDEDYKGQVLMFNNARDSFGISLKKLGFSQNTSNVDELNLAKEELQKQKNIIQAYVMDEIFPKMTNNEAAIAPYYAGDAITMIEDNPNLDFVVPNEGTNLFVDSMVILQNSKNKELAEQFINFMCDSEIAYANTSFTGYSTPLVSVKEMLDDDIKESHISYPPSEVIDKSQTFTTLSEETGDYLQNAWTEVLAYGDDKILTNIMLVIYICSSVFIFILILIKKKKSKLL